MKLDRRIRLLDVMNRRFGSGIQDMSLEDIRANRRSRMPHVPLVGGLVERLGEKMLGAAQRGVTIDQMQVPGPVGDVPVRRYRPQDVTSDAPLLVFLHGGGWVLGSPHQYDWLCTTVARDAGAVVASVDYRLAPEHRAPAAVEDAIAATTWLAEHAEEVGATGPVFVGGDSAGGNLSTLVAIAARDAGTPELAGQVLIYPGTDLTMSHPSITRLADAPIIGHGAIPTFLDHYLADEVAGDDPRVSPMAVEDLSGLAPALVQVAEHDPLVDEGTAYAARLREAGVDVRFTHYVGQPHGFVSLPGLCPAAHQAVAEIAEFVRHRA